MEKKNHCLKQILHLHDAPSQLFIKSLKISKFSAVLICNGKEFQIFGANLILEKSVFPFEKLNARKLSFA